MDIFNFFKKEKPIFTGYRFGFGSGGGGGGEGATITPSTGGTIVQDGSTKYHVFLNDDVFTCGDGPHSCTILAIGGGGASGDSRAGAGCGGGGGAGGYVNAPFTITNGTYPVTVGAGGPARPSPSTNVTPYPYDFPRFSGTPSSVNTVVTAWGGGQGGGHGLKAGGPGGSAGGGQDSQGPGTANRETGHLYNTITPTPQGNAGGPTSSGSNQRGGAGGGGASGAGSSGDDSRGGAGGDGVTAAPSFPVPLISPVVPGYTGLVCGGGHGGGGPDGENTAQNAWGGGGRSSPQVTQTEEGRDYSGGGGGANPLNHPDQLGHAGGKGLVIIKYTI